MKKSKIIIYITVSQFSIFGALANINFNEAKPELFLKDFYKWYNSQLNGSPAGISDSGKIEAYSILDNRLADKLIEIDRQQSRCHDLIGLDFDPFIGTQENSQNYAIDKVMKLSNGYRVSMFGVDNGEHVIDSNFEVDVVKTEKSWKIVDFHYKFANDTSLSEILNKTDLRCNRLK